MNYDLSDSDDEEDASGTDSYPFNLSSSGYGGNFLSET